MRRVHGPCAALLVAVMLSVACAAMAEPQRIAIGPYVQNVGKNSATICWSTLAGEVNYDPASQEKATGVRTYENHKTILRYLKPGTTYTYDVLGDGSDLGKGLFTTFPEGEQPFTFLAMSDLHGSQSPELIWKVMQRAIAEKPDLAFWTGDSVSNGLLLWHWEALFKAAVELMRSVPVYPALGNHELESPFYFDFFSLPGNQHYYSFDRSPAHFVVLDTWGPRMPYVYWRPNEFLTNQPVTQKQLDAFAERQQQYWREQMEWFKDDLASHQDAKYIFVFFHHPPHTGQASAQAQASRVRERFGTIFQDYKVSGVFAGHTHQYYHALAGGVHFVTTATAMNIDEADAPEPESLAHKKIQCYARVDVGPEHATVRIVDIDGNKIDEWEIPARSVTAAAPQLTQATWP